MLKRLELVGFKSFADRTWFSLPPGLTAIVGPNGSGKSNVVDAVKWLGGEEEFIGETPSEKDVGIVHTKKQDLLWFYGTIVIAPVVVLCLGLLMTMMRRRGGGRA